MPTDRYGNTLTSAAPEARDAYVEGCDLLLTLYPGALAALDRAIAADPDFALAHAARARALQGAGDAAGARQAAQQARALAKTDREASHAAIFALLAEGQAEAALEAVRQHVSTWPRDALVVSTAANQTGLIATSGRAGREQALLDFLQALAPHYRGDWWFNGHYAMALSELGHHAAARPLIERSMADQPRNASGAHAMAHFHYETGEADAAKAFLRGWLATYPRTGALHGHLSWHLALTHLQHGEMEDAFRLYDQVMAADDYPGPMLIKLLDAPSFLWRAELAGYPIDAGRWEALQAFAAAAFPRPGMPFADWHVALIDAVTGRTQATVAREAALDALVQAGRYAAGPTVLAVARAFAAFRRGDYADAIAAMEPVFDERERMAGSRAQLDLVEFTLLKACLAAGQTAAAAQLMRRRRSGPHAVPVAGVEAVLPG